MLDNAGDGALEDREGLGRAAMACGRAPGSRPQRTQEQKLGLWTRMAETQRGWGTPEQGRVGGQRATKPAANR